ncbi:helix-turn-helix domain-containing protein [Usitatibacter palustris]|uniref:Fumarate and nitrate reduction regulatory protein n=1 Tax=Usitatibacter palustris TaxID=2732487 RepID=A0A6M4H472_9PROT|nr:helix-turn-helix domain-containing protein [Usitatibacter palustris]QJR14250.1 Fumarate and nitrate reduction regulatory protein [Usitatibacter palustris]
MDAPVSIWPSQVGCAGCALHPLCEAADPVPYSLPAVDTRGRLEHGEALFEAGSPQGSIYAVRAGFLKVVTPVDEAGSRIVRFLMPGDAFGLEGFAARRHAGAAVALEDSEVCEITLRRAQVLADSFPPVAAHLRRLLAAEIADARMHAAVLAHRSAPQRLAGFLVDAARRWSDRGYSWREFRLPMERREIADYLGLTVETVSRVLSVFRERGWISVKGRHVSIHDLEGLASCPRAL